MTRTVVLLLLGPLLCFCAPGDPPPATASPAPTKGRLAPEVIQRIVRANFGRFRICYETGLAADAKLQGRVTTKFVIDTDGNVLMTADGGSDMPDPKVVACVVKGFGALKFPKPEGGIVTVVYPIQFNPGD